MGRYRTAGKKSIENPEKPYTNGLRKQSWILGLWPFATRFGGTKFDPKPLELLNSRCAEPFTHSQT